MFKTIWIVASIENGGEIIKITRWLKEMIVCDKKIWHKTKACWK